MLEATEDSPLVILNAHSGKMKISGRSIMADTIPFQTAILDWLRKKVTTSDIPFCLDIDLEYINSDSHKMLLHVVGELNKYFIFGKKVSINWQTQVEDEYMADVIQEFKESFDLPINEIILV